MRIVPAFDVAEEDEACVRVGREAMLRETLAFEGGEKACRHRVVVRITTRAHRRSDAEELTPLPEGKGSGLTALIGDRKSVV